MKTYCDEPGTFIAEQPAIRKLGITGAKQSAHEKRSYRIEANVTQSSSSKVFGIGLSRTGTKSLTYALHQLGLHIAHFPDDPVTFHELSTGNYRFSLLNTQDGIADITVSSFYPQLDQLFPNSKFILTIRNRQDWLRSLEQHWANNPCFNDPKKQRPEDAVHMNIRQLLCKTVYGRYEFDQDSAIQTYERHLSQVKQYFSGRPNDLLTLNICEGETCTSPPWHKLCQFLDKPLPKHTFPKVKERAELTTLLQAGNNAQWQVALR